MANDDRLGELLEDVLGDLTSDEPEPPEVTRANAYGLARATWGDNAAVLRALGYHLGKPGTKSRRDWRTANRALQRSATGQHATLSERYRAKIARALRREWRETNTPCGVARYMERAAADVEIAGWVRVSKDLRHRTIAKLVAGRYFRAVRFAAKVCAGEWAAAAEALVRAHWAAYLGEGAGTDQVGWEEVESLGVELQ